MAASLFRTALLWARTIIRLRPVQIYGRAWFRLYRPKPRLLSGLPQAREVGNWSATGRRPTMTGPLTFGFLNETHTLEAAADWNNPNRAKLWLYNLHYFDDLVADDASARRAWHIALITRWIAENPPTQGNGWEPYPTSLRIVNWIKWALTGKKLTPGMLGSLMTQSDWLTRRLEYHLLGNHLFANAKALVFAGCFFDGPHAARWLKCGLAILCREIPEQIQPNGEHFERSPMYHAILTEDVLDLAQLADIFPQKIQPQDRQRWRDIAATMINYLAMMMHPDQRIAFFNDSAFGIAPEFAALTDAAARMRIGVLPPRPEPENTTAAGYHRLQSANAVLFCDTAPIGPDYLPGHAHADTLSFELSLHRQRVIVNGGTSVYGGDDARRLFERSTAAHNTVEVDGQNSSEIWSSFRAARRAAVHDVKRGESLTRLSASHDGFRRFGGPLHHRAWALTDTSLTITDRLDGEWSTATARMRIAPPFTATPVLIDGPCPIHITATGGTVRVEDGDWAPEFGKVVPCQVLVLDLTEPEASITLSWDP